jgi:hypothetical protein
MSTIDEKAPEQVVTAPGTEDQTSSLDASESGIDAAYEKKIM